MSETQDKLKSVVAHLFKCDVAELTDKTGPGDIPGWDSLGHVALMAEIQKQFGTHVPVEDAIEVESIAGLAEVLDRLQDWALKIAGKTIVVTGGAAGLGLAMATHLARLGAEVWAIDNDPAALASAPAATEDEAKIRLLRGDVGDAGQVTAAIGEILAKSAGIDVLINNAAVLHDQTLVSKLGGKIKLHSIADWESTLRSNLTGTFLMAREVAASMIAGKRPGLIVNISSISRGGNPGQSAYAATKGAIDALTATWSQELASFGIRVVAVAPGFIETGMTKAIPPMFLDQIRDRTPVKRFGTAAEIAHAIQFAIENDYVNGKVIEVDGGLRF